MWCFTNTEFWTYIKGVHKVQGVNIKQQNIWWKWCILGSWGYLYSLLMMMMMMMMMRIFSWDNEYVLDIGQIIDWKGITVGLLWYGCYLEAPLFQSIVCFSNPLHEENMWHVGMACLIISYAFQFYSRFVFVNAFRFW